MKKFLVRITPRKWSRAALLSLTSTLVLAEQVYAAPPSPWENAVTVLQTAFTTTIARGLSLVAIVVSGLTFAFGEGGSKRIMAGVLFGIGMANSNGFSTRPTSCLCLRAQFRTN